MLLKNEKVHYCRESTSHVHNILKSFVVVFKILQGKTLEDDYLQYLPTVRLTTKFHSTVEHYPYLAATKGNMTTILNQRKVNVLGVRGSS